MHKTPSILLALVATATSLSLLSTPVRDDLGGRSTFDLESESGIVEVAYLESTGSQYYLFPEAINGIDCFILPQSNVSYSHGQSVGRFNGGSRTDGIVSMTLHGYGLSVYNGGISSQVITHNLSRDHLFHVVVWGTVVDVDDIAYTMGGAWAAESFFRNVPFALFGSYRIDTETVQPQSCRIGRCALYIGNTLLYDLVPVRFKGIGYMLDTLTGELLANQGTGEFILGPDIAPLEY